MIRIAALAIFHDLHFGSETLAVGKSGLHNALKFHQESEVFVTGSELLP